MTEIEEKNRRIREFTELMRDAELPDSFVNWLEANGFFTAPASRYYHGSNWGGLFDHSKCVTELLIQMTKNNGLVWENKRSPLIVGMFHDLCKIDEYVPEYDLCGHHIGWDKNVFCTLKGHGDKSVILLQQHFGALTEEEILCIINHMGAFTDKSLWPRYQAAAKKCENVLWTHHADIIAAYTYNT